MALLGEETSPGDIAGILTRVKGMLPGDRFSMEINSALKPESLRPALSSLLKLGCYGRGWMPPSVEYTFQERPSILLAFRTKMVFAYLI